MPSSSRVDGLKGVGLLGKHAAVSFNVAISDSQQEAIAVELVRLGRRISRKDANNFTMINKGLKPCKLSIKGKVGWDSDICQIANLSDVNVVSELEVGQPPCTDMRCLAFYSCPHCSKVEPSTNTAFQRIELDRKVRCTHCYHYQPVKLWNCECNVKWHLCQVHAAPNTCVAMVTAPMGQTSCNKGILSQKRKLSPASTMTFDEMLAADHNRDRTKKLRANKEPGDRIISLGDWKHTTLRSSFLSPALRTRFPDTVGCT